MVHDLLAGFTDSPTVFLENISVDYFWTWKKSFRDEEAPGVCHLKKKNQSSKTNLSIKAEQLLFHLGLRKFSGNPIGHSNESVLTYRCLKAHLNNCYKCPQDFHTSGTSLFLS